MDLQSAQRNAGDDFSRQPLHCLSAGKQLDTFEPLEYALYRIAVGDTLYDIARIYYGSDWINLWPVIANANRISSATNLPVGLIISIPDPHWRTK
jgi:nucleoid-associated protein YgaU